MQQGLLIKFPEFGKVLDHFCQKKTEIVIDVDFILLSVLIQPLGV